MSERRRGLGRGLGALIPQAPSAGDGEATDEGAAPSSGAMPGALTGMAMGRGVSSAVTGGGTGPVAADGQTPAAAVQDMEPVNGVAGARFAELDVDSITPNPRQPRDNFDEDAMAELVASIKEVGLLQPVVVRPTERPADGDGAGPGYELIMGERRWRACREAGLEVIPAIVRQTEDERLLLDALLENLHRAQLNPLEEAAAYDQLLRDFNCTHDELADRIGRSRPQVTNTIRLLRLSPEVQRRVAAGVLSAGHARALLALDNAEEQDRLAQRIVAEGLSVRAVEEIVTLQTKGSAPASRRRAPRAGKRVSPALDRLADRLSDRFETRVKVDLGQKKGKIVVEFASIEDLQRILGQLAPDEGRVLDQADEADEADA
ncbi:ParB/RepB/Spo0J family partition protein [Streptomyces aidingensis]|uniref:Chromosome partitioning protein, ParB family n=1 Tax=Streptomyces aidingensis TaxID=910347 RepID=A0A1I1QWD9_9ACTN|nr:ParB/RepB/Spo0J family partition protein [Streptomyces aidingensis]SFD22350.1 chromosome partitioning protein, ParB family [Streptomyces aidingensis]